MFVTALAFGGGEQSGRVEAGLQEERLHRASATIGQERIRVLVAEAVGKAHKQESLATDLRQEVDQNDLFRRQEQHAVEGKIHGRQQRACRRGMVGLRRGGRRGSTDRVISLTAGDQCFSERVVGASSAFRGLRCHVGPGRRLWIDQGRGCGRRHGAGVADGRRPRGPEPASGRAQLCHQVPVVKVQQVRVLARLPSVGQAGKRSCRQREVSAWR